MMENTVSCHKQIEKTIKAMPSGTVFSISDFLELGEAKTISKILGRISDSGSIEKIIRGVFWKPSEYGPSPERIALAIAKENNWKVMPCGDSALNVFGLGNHDKIKIWTYITNGTYRNYSWKGINISFKHAASKVLKDISSETASLIQIIKAFGPNISQEQKQKIRNLFSADQIKTILKETHHMTSWVAIVAKSIFKLEKN